MTRIPTIGPEAGIGLRPPHYGRVRSERPPCPWFEVHSENYFGLGGEPGGQPLRLLLEIRESYPISLHGVSLSIGSTDPLSRDYLNQLRNLSRRVEPCLISDHLCWASIEGQHLHDLFPLPYTEEAIEHLVPRVQQVQDFLGREILLENVSSYLEFTHSTMPEWEFLNEVCDRSGCGVLLDLNNIYVSAQNHAFDPAVYLDAIRANSVGEIHLAGHTQQGKLLIDTHNRPIIEPVWTLYRKAIAQLGPTPTLIEWDDELPELDFLLSEAQRAEEIQEEIHGPTRTSGATAPL